MQLNTDNHGDIKPRVLILGGVGFLGRHLVSYLFNNKLASHVCVADKMKYMIAGLSESEIAIYSDRDFLTFKAADLSNSSHVEKVFAGGNWQYIFNCVGVTKYSQEKEVHQDLLVISCLGL